jgi:hypothetical protein
MKIVKKSVPNARGSITAGNYGSAALAPIRAFGSLSREQNGAVAGFGAALGGLLYYDLSQ